MPVENGFIVISIGNSRSRVGRVVGEQIVESRQFSNDHSADATETILEWWSQLDGIATRSIVVASVNEPVSRRLISAVEDQLGITVYRVGEDVPIPIGWQLDPETITGVDRLLNAAAVFDRIRQACIIVDAGTAVTVDFVDGEGTFHGGAIAPGAAMQLQALHEHTAALPELAFQVPDDEAFGRNTAQAMYQGVYQGIRGLVHRLVEQYAEHYGAFPMVVATGGDAATLFEHDELVDRIVPDLTLQGMAIAARHAFSEQNSPAPLDD